MADKKSPKITPPSTSKMAVSAKGVRLMIAGVLVMVAGFLLLSGGGSDDPRFSIMQCSTGAVWWPLQ